MTEELRTFGYLCPQCGKTVRASRDLFSLTSSGTQVPCGCGASVLRAEYNGQGFDLTVPCGLCGQTHEVRCPQDRVLRGNTALSCAKTGQFCAFIGDEGTVERHLNELKLLAEKESDGAFTDSVIMYEVLSELRDIAARPGGITCRCGEERVRMKVRQSAVDLICPRCGGRLRIPALTDRDLDDLCCRMRLVIPGAAPEDAP